MNVLGHCTGRLVEGSRGTRPQSTFDARAVFAACAEHDVAVEINSRPERQDPPDELIQVALEAGCRFSIDSDAHAPGHFSFLDLGAARAEANGVPADRIVTTWPVERLLEWAGREALSMAPHAEGSPSETRGELLGLVRRQAGRRRPTDLLAHYRRDGFVMPSMLDQRLANTLDRLALEAAADFDAVLLSPVAPLGTSSVVAPTSQDRTLSTTRGSEVVSDPTNVLALECAARLLAAPQPVVRLATVHQTLRAQTVTNPGGARSRHFRLFALAEAGAGLPDDEFEVRAVARQLHAYDRLFDLCASVLPVQFPGRRAIVRVDERGQALAQRLVDRLVEAMPHVELSTEPLESRYYSGLRVGFGAAGRSGDFVEIADLGRFDWVGAAHE